MAIYHCSIKNISRAGGRSAIASAAYRSGERLYNDETGLVHDFTRKGGVVFTEIMLPENAPPKYQDRETLWNEVQKIESRSDARLAREVEVALPVEMNRDEQIECVRKYIMENFTSKGMIADWALHDKGDGNPHAHILLTCRALTPEHEWDTKCRSVFANDIDTEGRAVFDPDKPTYDPKDKEHTEQYRIPVYDEKKLKAWEASHGRAFDLNTDRDQIKEVQACRVREGKGCEYKWQKVNIPSNDWNDRANAEIWRESWAKYCNEYLSPENHIDHRSYARQGIDLEPTIHEGITARKMESDGKVADRVQINREIAERNSLRKQIKQIAQELTAAITEKARDIYGQFREFIGSIGTAGADAERDRDADLGQTVTTASAERQRLGDTADDIREFINGLNAEERASEEKRDAALSEREDREIERKRQTADRSFEERAERDRALRQSKSRARISYGPQIGL